MTTTPCRPLPSASSRLLGALFFATVAATSGCGMVTFRTGAGGTPNAGAGGASEEPPGGDARASRGPSLDDVSEGVRRDPTFAWAARCESDYASHQAEREAADRELGDGIDAAMKRPTRNERLSALFALRRFQQHGLPIDKLLPHLFEHFVGARHRLEVAILEELKSVGADLYDPYRDPTATPDFETIRARSTEDVEKRLYCLAATRWARKHAGDWGALKDGLDRIVSPAEREVLEAKEKELIGVVADHWKAKPDGTPGRSDMVPNLPEVDAENPPQEGKLYRFSTEQKAPPIELLESRPLPGGGVALDFKQTWDGSEILGISESKDRLVVSGAGVIQRDQSIKYGTRRRIRTLTVELAEPPPVALEKGQSIYFVGVATKVTVGAEKVTGPNVKTRKESVTFAAKLIEKVAAVTDTGWKAVWTLRPADQER